MMRSLVDWVEEATGVALRRASSRSQEMRGACPFCGGDTTSDRFIVWPERDRYWCRQCHRHGDCIQFLRDVRGLSFRRAAEIVGRGVPLAPVRKSPTQRGLEDLRAKYQQWETALLALITRDYWHAWDLAETVELHMTLLLVQAEPAAAEEWEQWHRLFDTLQNDLHDALQRLDFFQHPATLPERVLRWEREGEPP